MKNKETIIPIIISLIAFVTVISTYYLIANQKKYSCYDYENDITYKFKTENEMHKVCDKIDGTTDDQIITKYNIYGDLIKIDDPDFAFYPYLDENKELVITISIANCKNKEESIKKAENWFNDNSYNINNYNIEYEYPCDIDE